MWPWLMIIAGTLIIIGALVARQRMMRTYRDQLAQAEAESRGTTLVPDVTPAAIEPRAPESVPDTRSYAVRPPSAEPLHKPAPLFADLPVGHRLTAAPTLRVRAQEVPLQDWLRYHSDGNAWSGVIQSISDRITGDRELQPYFGAMDRATLQRHVMSTVMMLTGEGVTVGAVRRLAAAHLEFVQSGGEPITDAVWDRLAATLANAMREHLVPEQAVRGLDRTAAPLRSVIVGH